MSEPQFSGPSSIWLDLCKIALRQFDHAIEVDEFNEYPVRTYILKMSKSQPVTPTTKEGVK